MTESHASPLIRLTPSLRHYAWGDPAYLLDLLGLDATGKPCAEAWYGAHAVAPATARTPEGERPLDALLQARGEAVLGREAAARFGELPYLLKLLAAARPLSIQVHPDRAQAEAGFAREEAAGLPRDARARCYRDPNHKPELLVALTDFEALCGFRPPQAIADTLAALPELAALLPAFEPTPAGLRALLEAWYALPDAQVAPALARLLARLAEVDAGAGEASPATGASGASVPPATGHPVDLAAAARWALRAHEALSDGGPPDRGLLFVFLLELVHLAPGQGIHIPAGVPHAYLRGAGVEIMANSDNVLRAGLTGKHVDPAELLRIVRFDAARPPLLEAVETARGGEGTWHSPAVEFELGRLRLEGPDGPPALRRAQGPETLLAAPDAPETVVTVTAAGGSLALRRGEACLVPHGTEYRVEAVGPATVFRAALPGEPAGAFRGREPTRLRFGTSGLRGLVEDITDLEAYINTRGFLDYLFSEGDAVPGRRVALGGDLRPSTDSPERSILRAVARAVVDAGLEPVYCGRIPTPALTYYGLQKGWPSIVVTGSHIPFDRNGIKFNKSTGEVLKSDEAGILEAVERVRRLEYGRAPEDSLFDDAGFFRPGAAAPLPEPTDEARRLYVRRTLDAFSDDALGGLRIALYEHSAVGREVVAEILRGLGAEVFPAGRAERFVAIDTEALSEERLGELQRLADEVRAEVGPLDALVSTDGDSDRPLLVGFDGDHRVRFFGGDVLGALVADALHADAIAVPVSSSDLIDRHFGPRGVTVARTRIGSPWVIAAMQTLSGRRRVGWEANGGFLTGSTLTLEHGALAPLPTRDAVLPLVTALHAVRRTGRPLVELFRALPGRHSRAGLLDAVPPEQSRALLARFVPGGAGGAVRAVRFEAGEARWTDHAGEEHPATGELAAALADVRERVGRHFHRGRGFGPLESIDYLDGIRMSFQGGDVAHVRPSGNAPQLRIYAVADTEARAEEIVALGLEEPRGLLRGLLRDED